MSMPKPKISLKIGGGGSFGTRSPSVSTPTPGGSHKIIKLSLGSKPSTPSEATPKTILKTKAGRAPKPSAKAAANKNGKRAKDDSEEEEEDEGNSIIVDTFRLPASKKIRLSMGGATTPKTPVLKVKHKGKPPKRPKGEGYDSEASDREEDPVIEEEFILRMHPGSDCDYLRDAIARKTIGLRPIEGGADVQMKFVHAEGRRALVTIRGQHYAATLVDLPTVLEGMKSWDKKGWFKSADICQMLYVFKKISRESEASTVDLPKEIDQETFQYPHGITAPMRFARKRRFRKRISRTAIEAVEDAVEKLLAADAEAISTRHEELRPERSRMGSQDYGSPNGYDDEEEYSADENADAEGDLDDDVGYFGHSHGGNIDQQQMVEEDEEEDDFAAIMEAALAEEAAATPSSNAIGETPDVLRTNDATPDASGKVDEDSGDESVEDDDEDVEGESDDEIDEDEKTRLAQLEGAKEDIAEMEKQLANLEAQLATQANPILKKRIKDNIGKVRAELQLKKSAIGEGDED